MRNSDKLSGLCDWRRGRYKLKRDALVGDMIGIHFLVDSAIYRVYNSLDEIDEEVSRTPRIMLLYHKKSQLHQTLQYAVFVVAVSICAAIFADLFDLSECAARKSLKPGLVWAHFDEAQFQSPRDAGVDRQINWDTGTEHQNYARVWIGLLEAPVTGTISFFAEADNALKLLLADQLVIDGWGMDMPREGTFAAQKGQFLPLELRFFQYGGTAHLRLYWNWSGKERELIPPSAFWHDEADLQRAQDLLKGTVNMLKMKSEIYGTQKPSSAKGPPVRQPIRLSRGLHLFLDDFLIEMSQNVERKVNCPERTLSNPIITGKEDKNFQPYVSVIRDRETGRFRMWYGVPVDASQSHLAHIESENGIDWIRPHRVLDDPAPIQFGTSVIDEGHDFPNPQERFKYAYYGRHNGGLNVAGSPDGMHWTPLAERAVLKHNHDLNNIFRDSRRDLYTAMVNAYTTGNSWSGKRRVTMQSVSEDLINWREPWLVVTPDDEVDEGETQFYGLSALLTRGDLLVGMVKILRDDLFRGIGYTSLAWSRDGEHWTRDPAVFFHRNSQQGTWDHAMAWIDCQLLVDDELYLYYGGYAQGHKVNRFEERQIGMLIMPRDRYVAREAGATVGVLRTPPLILEGDRITLNVDARDGEARVQLLDENGTPVPGFSLADCQPIRDNALAATVEWGRSLDELPEKPVRLEFSLRNARLFAFHLK